MEIKVIFKKQYFEYKTLIPFLNHNINYSFVLISLHLSIDTKIKDWQIIDNDDKDHSDC